MPVWEMEVLAGLQRVSWILWPPLVWQPMVMVFVMNMEFLRKGFAMESRYN